jgi:predicted protein tyrosine phosphatase
MPPGFHSPTTEPGPPPVKDTVDECLALLARNGPVKEILARLNRLERQIENNPYVRARLLRARAIACARLDLPGEALANLEEARRLLIDAAQPRELAEVERMVARVHSWRGDGREAALALLRAVAVATAAGDQGAAGMALADVERTVAMVHSWRGDGREAAFALLRAVAVATAADDQGAAGMALLDAGRLEMEIGRPAQAKLFFALGLQLAGDKLSARERARDMVSLLQSLVAAGRFDKVTSCLQALSPLLPEATVRVRFLTELEMARVAIALGKHGDAAAALDRAEAMMHPSAESFEATELKHARAELALATGDYAHADTLLNEVIARCAADDLAGREVVARLLQARALFGLERPDEEVRTLAAALRRALARGLNGYADAARSLIAAAGASEDEWLPSEPARAEAACFRSDDQTPPHANAEYTADLTLSDFIEIAGMDRSRRISLYRGDLSSMPERVDFLVVSASPDNYEPVPGTVIESLEKKGISVATLARNKEHDLRRSCGFWVSKDLSVLHPQCGFRRLLCFEPEVIGFPPQVIGELFRGMFPFLDMSRGSTVATSLIAAGSQRWGPREMFRLLVESAIEWLRRDLPINELKIVVRSATLATALAGELRIIAEAAPRNPPKSLTPNYDVFLSYSSRDATAARLIKEQILARKNNVLVFDFKNEIDIGKSYQEEIDRSIESCRKIITLMSPSYFCSPKCQEELQIARLRNKRADHSILFPIYWQSLDTELKLWIQALNYDDCRERDERKLLDALSRFVEKAILQ